MFITVFKWRRRINQNKKIGAKQFWNDIPGSFPTSWESVLCTGVFNVLVGWTTILHHYQWNTMEYFGHMKLVVIWIWSHLIFRRSFLLYSICSSVEQFFFLSLYLSVCVCISSNVYYYFISLIFFFCYIQIIVQNGLRYSFFLEDEFRHTLGMVNILSKTFINSQVDLCSFFCCCCFL